MNKKTALFTIIMAIAGMLVACEADFTTEKKSEMVVEGWIDEGGISCGYPHQKPDHKR